MPMKPVPPCNQSGCPARAVALGRCAAHAQPPRQYDTYRGTSTQRGYDYAWQQRRTAYLYDYPDCASCGRQATEVHHRYGVEAGHEDDNLMSLCHSCHVRITKQASRT